MGENAPDSEEGLVAQGEDDFARAGEAVLGCGE